MSVIKLHCNFTSNGYLPRIEVMSYNDNREQPIMELEHLHKIFNKSAANLAQFLNEFQSHFDGETGRNSLLHREKANFRSFINNFISPTEIFLLDEEKEKHKR